VVMQAGPPPTLAENILSAPGPAPDGDLTGTRIQFTCTPGASDTYCPLREPGTHQHQCMLVALSEGSNVLPVKFSKAADYRNMNFETLSELSRPATITLKGLQEIAGEAKDRDVYLYVKTKNLPPHGSKPVWLQTQKMAKAKEYATNRPKIPRRDQKRRGAPAERSLARAAGNDAAEDASALDKSVTNESLDRYADLAPVLSGHQALLEAYPTYEVHAYFDSGKLVTRGKAQLKRLVEMIPFGFFL